MAFHPAPGSCCQGIGVVGQFFVLNPLQQDAQTLTGPVPALVRNAAVIDEILRTDRHGGCQHSHILAEGFRPFRIGIFAAAADDITDRQGCRLMNGLNEVIGPIKRPLQGFTAEPFFDISFSRIGKEMKFHMSLDQPGHPFGKGRFLAPAQQHGFRHFRSFRIMAVIGIAAFFFTANTGQPFGHIVEQSGIANGSPLAEDIKTKSLAVFQALAEAEAKVHGVSVDEIHFHEVGAIDCILDIVGTVWCLNYLGIEQISTSSLHAGSGFVRCAHGIMPVPARNGGTLSGIPWYSTDIKGELVTPTGAALVKVLAHTGKRPADFIYHTVAYGAGTKNLVTPNVLRGFIGEASPL